MWVREFTGRGLNNKLITTGISLKQYEIYKHIAFSLNNRIEIILATYNKVQKLYKAITFKTGATNEYTNRSATNL